MAVKISEVFEGTCTVCGKKAKVFSAGDDKTFKMLSICRSCTVRLGADNIASVIEKYGFKPEDLKNKA